MDFNFSEDQNAIRELANQIFGDRATDEFLLAFSREGGTYDASLWQTLADQGLLGIAVPEAAGGSGLGLVELCLVLEEQGRRVAPVPLFASLVLGGLPIAQFGTDAQQQRYLGPLAAGELKLSAAIAELGMTGALATGVSASPAGDGWTLEGERAAVPDGAAADAILVPATTADGQSAVFLVPADAAGVTVTPEMASSMKDEGQRYRDYRHWVFGRDGKPCRECGEKIERMAVSSRGLFYCPACQPRK